MASAIIVAVKSVNVERPSSKERPPTKFKSKSFTSKDVFFLILMVLKLSIA